MLIDLISPNNQCTFNLSVAQKLGLEESIYISYLLGKQLHSPSYMVVDKQEVQQSTTLSPVKVKNIHNKFIDMGLLICDPNGEGGVWVNLDYLSKVLEKGVPVETTSKKTSVNVFSGKCTNLTNALSQFSKPKPVEVPKEKETIPMDSCSLKHIAQFLHTYVSNVNVENALYTYYRQSIREGCKYSVQRVKDDVDRLVKESGGDEEVLFEGVVYSTEKHWRNIYLKKSSTNTTYVNSRINQETVHSSNPEEQIQLSQKEYV